MTLEKYLDHWQNDSQKRGVYRETWESLSDETKDKIFQELEGASSLDIRASSAEKWLRPHLGAVGPQKTTVASVGAITYAEPPRPEVARDADLSRIHDTWPKNVLAKPVTYQECVGDWDDLVQQFGRAGAVMACTNYVDSFHLGEVGEHPYKITKFLGDPELVERWRKMPVYALPQRELDWLQQCYDLYPHPSSWKETDRACSRENRESWAKHVGWDYRFDFLAAVQQYKEDRTSIAIDDTDSVEERLQWTPKFENFIKKWKENCRYELKIRYAQNWAAQAWWALRSVCLDPGAEFQRIVGDCIQINAMRKKDLRTGLLWAWNNAIEEWPTVYPRLKMPEGVDLEALADRVMAKEDFKEFGHHWTGHPPVVLIE